MVTGKTHAEAWSKMPAGYCNLPYKNKSEDDAIRDLIEDCEIQHHIENGIISSSAKFYGFL